MNNEMDATVWNKDDGFDALPATGGASVTDVMPLASDVTEAAGAHNHCDDF